MAICRLSILLLLLLILHSITAFCPHFSERVVNVWNNLLASVDFKSLSSFKRTVKHVDLSKFLKCFYDDDDDDDDDDNLGKPAPEM